MKANSKINYSFVIPHHNTPDLLQRLVDSIPQREDIEIIVVDDNSDEKKKAKVERSDVQTIFIDKDHSKGAGRARNIGMEAAKGNWLLFADADDFYNPNFIDVLDEYKDEDIEVLFFSVNYVDSDTLLPVSYDIRQQYSNVVKNYDGSSKAKDELLFFGWTPWHKMQKSSFVKKYGFRFEEVPKGNDVFFSLQIGYFVEKWEVDKRELYTVTQYKNGITFGRESKIEYKYAIERVRKRGTFFSYIGHSDWNRQSIRGNYKQSVLLYIYKVFRHQPHVGIKALFYYITNYFKIKRVANHYVEVIEDLKQRVQ